MIKYFEGCILYAYNDPHTGGLPITIGWGSTKDFNGNNFKLGDKITQYDADRLLDYQLKNEYLPALKRIPYWEQMNENQKGALLSFAYNCGYGFYGSSNFSTITKVLKDKEWNKVPDAMYLYHNPGSNVSEGLKRRRKVEGDLWKK